MEYTGQMIEDLVFARVRSELASAIGGDCYKRDTRPLDSKQEDCVVAFVTGTSEQMQQGAVVVNVYVPDIKAGNGMFYKDTARCKELEQVLISLPDKMNIGNDVRFEKSGMIMTIEEREIKQHFVSLKLRFKNLI